MQNRINPKGPPVRQIKPGKSSVKRSKQDDWEALSPTNDRIIDNMLYELFKRKRIDNKGNYILIEPK